MVRCLLQQYKQQQKAAASYARKNTQYAMLSEDEEVSTFTVLSPTEIESRAVAIVGCFRHSS